MQKTNRGAAKRFKVTAKGRIKHKKAYLRHQLSCKTEKQKRNLKKHDMLSDSDVPRVKRMLCLS